MRSERARKPRWQRPSRLTATCAALGLLFLHVPVWVIALYAFTTEDRTYQFPPPGLTLHWFEVAFARSDIWAAMRLSLLVATVATSSDSCIAAQMSLRAKATSNQCSVRPGGGNW